MTLRNKVDVCDYCEAELTELKDIHEEDWTGSLRSYACGYTLVDGQKTYFCPADPQYPTFEEFEIELQGQLTGGWKAYTFPKTEKARMVRQHTSFGRTENEAIENLKEAYYENPSKKKESDAIF